MLRSPKSTAEATADRQRSPIESQLPLRLAMAVPAAAIVIVVLAGTWPMLSWPYPLWVQTSAQFHQQFTWAGLIAGTTACWQATRHRPHLAGLVSWLVGAYLAALLPLVVCTVLVGGVGAPDPLAMLSGVMAMVAAVAVGYTLGTVVPSVVMVPIVAIGFYALRIAGGTYAASPVLNLEPGLGQHESMPLLVFRITLFSAISAAAVGLTGKSLARRATDTPQPWRKVVDIATYAAVPATLITISLIHPPAVFTASNPPPMSCTERHGIHYCVHADNQPRLAELVRTVDPMVVRFGTTPANLNRVWDYALTFHPIDAELARGLEIAWLNSDGTLRTQVSDTMAGVQACATAATQDQQSGTRRAQVAADISDYLSTGTTFGTLATMSVTDVQQWIAQHQQQLHTCTLPPDQLPQAQTR